MAPLATELRGFAPIPPEDRPDPPSKPSQSLLAQLENCARAGYFYLRYGGGVQTHAMARGSAFHEFAERATKHMIESGEVQLPLELAVSLMEEVIRDGTEWTFPASDRKALLAMANNWAKATFIDPACVVAIERMVELPLGGWTIRGKLDRLERVNDALGIVDYKTSLSLPSQEKFERGFQGPFYALLATRGVYEDTGKPVAPGQVNEVHFAEQYPRYYTDYNQSLSSRGTVYAVEDLVEFQVAVEDLLARMEHGLETGEWPATPGDHCARCPAPQLCPIPQQFRYIETATTDAEARAVWDRATIMDQEVKRLKASVREYVKAAEAPVAINDQLELGFTLVESETIKNKDALRAFLEQTPGADPSDFYTTRSSTRFGLRKRDA